MDKKTLAILTGIGLGGLGLGWYLLSKSQQPIQTTTSTVSQQLGLQFSSPVFNNGQLTITVQNTGNVEYTYYIGCTVVANGIDGEGCNLNAHGNPYVDIQPQSITLQPGQSQQITFDLTQALQKLSQYQDLYVIIKGYSDNAMTTCITGTSIQITNPYYVPPKPGLSIDNMIYSNGTITVIVTNTGTGTFTYYIGLTLVANSIGGSGCSLNASGNPYVDITPQSITLAPGQKGQVTFNVSSALQQLSQYQTVYAISKGYSDSSLQNCLSGLYLIIQNPYFVPKPGLSITNVYSSGGNIYVTVQNTGNAQFTYYIGLTVVANGISGSGCNLNASGNPYVDLPWQTVTLNPGQSTTVSFDITSAMQQLSQYQNLYVIVKGWINQ